jgi:ATP/ADP translocase
LNHEFFEEFNIVPNLNHKLFKNIMSITKKEFSTFKRMNLMILSDLVALNNSQFLKEMKDSFMLINTSNSGEISLKEF